MLPSFHRERKAHEWSSNLLVRHIVSLFLSFNHPVLFYFQNFQKNGSVRAMSVQLCLFMLLLSVTNKSIEKSSIGFTWRYNYILSQQVWLLVKSLLFMKVHISRSRFEDYANVGDVQTFTTSDPNSTKIHACKPQVSRSSAILSLIHAVQSNVNSFDQKHTSLFLV